jgi:hypothetical protein
MSEPPEMFRFRALGRAIVERALLDLLEKGSEREDAWRFLFDDSSRALVAHRAFVFDLADISLDRLRAFVRASDRRRQRRFAHRLVQTVSGLSGG